MTAEISINTTNQPDTKSNRNFNTTTKQHAVVSIQLKYIHISGVSRYSQETTTSLQRFHNTFRCHCHSAILPNENC